MKIDTRDTLVAEVANALSENFENITSYLNLTTQEVGVYMDPSLCGDDCKWPNDGDEVIRIEPLSSRESFYAMAEFADKQPDDISQKLYDTLNKKHPFANFKEAINRLNITQQWYDFSNDWYNAKAEEWLADNEVDFVDDKIVTSGATIIWDEEE